MLRIKFTAQASVLFDITFQNEDLIKISDKTAAYIFKLMKNPGSVA
jgi:hypothetical protein